MDACILCNAYLSTLYTVRYAPFISTLREFIEDQTADHLEFILYCNNVLAIAISLGGQERLTIGGFHRIGYLTVA